MAEYPSVSCSGTLNNDDDNNNLPRRQQQQQQQQQTHRRPAKERNMQNTTLDSFLKAPERTPENYAPKPLFGLRRFFGSSGRSEDIYRRDDRDVNTDSPFDEDDNVLPDSPPDMPPRPVPSEQPPIPPPRFQQYHPVVSLF